eukprot:1452234-Rhodomonas_salina.1
MRGVGGESFESNRATAEATRHEGRGDGWGSCAEGREGRRGWGATAEERRDGARETAEETAKGRW